MKISARKMIDIIGETIFPGQSIVLKDDIAEKPELDKVPSPVEKGKVEENTKRKQAPIT